MSTGTALLFGSSGSAGGTVGVPVGVSASAGDAQVTVSFSPPVSGPTPNLYRVTMSPGGLTQTGAGSPITRTGLTNGQAYTATVAASADGGSSWGAESSPSNSVTPTGGAVVADIWVAAPADGGSDANSGLTQGAPKATLSAARALITASRRLICILNPNGTAQFNTRSTYFSLNVAGTSDSDRVVWFGHPSHPRPQILGQVGVAANYQTLRHVWLPGIVDRPWPGGSSNGTLVEISHSTIDRTGTIVEDNLIEHGWSNATIFVRTRTGWGIIRRNTIRNAGWPSAESGDPTSGAPDHGIYYESGTDWIIENNLIHYCRARCISAHNPSDSTITRLTVRHNTLIGSGDTGMYLGGIHDSTLIVNNLIAFNETGIRTNTSGDQYQFTGTATALSNRLWGAAPAAQTNTIPAAITNGGDNVVENPSFVAPLVGRANEASYAPLTNPDAYDWHLGASSPVLGEASLTAGHTVSDDLDGNPRSGAKDPGCYERA